MRSLLSFLLVVFALAGCGGPVTAELEIAQQKWASQSLRSSYQYEFTQSCFCPEAGEPMLIQVKDDKVASITRKKDGSAVTDELGWRPTIDMLLSEVAKANGQAAELRATFDSSKGFPASVYIDWIKDAVDDEESYTVTDVKAVP